MKITRFFSNDLLQEHQLCFVHIPKTSGSSFTDILHAIVGRGKLLQIFPEVLLGHQKPTYDIDQFACVAGHFTFEIHKVMKKHPLFLTFLREPLARSISSFQQYRRFEINAPFIKQIPLDDAYEQLSGMTLEDFINHPFFSDAVNNLQTRMLGLSIKSPNPSLANLQAELLDDRYFSLELAKERLEQFLFIGIQEEFQMSVEMTAYQFGFFPLSQIPKLNISQEKILIKDLPDGVLNRLHELNQLDTELYDFGVKLFRERYNQMIAEITTTNGDEKRPVVELLAERYWDQKGQSKSLSYKLDLIHPTKGWHAAEVVGDQQWMWSGPENISSIDLPLDRSVKFWFQFQIRHYLSEDVLNSLELHIDDQLILLERITEDGIPYFQGSIPPNPRKRYERTRFSFHVKETIYPPGMTAESRGARLLGVALGWMEIKAISPHPPLGWTPAPSAPPPLLEPTNPNGSREN